MRAYSKDLRQIVVTLDCLHTRVCPLIALLLLLPTSICLLIAFYRALPGLWTTR